MDRHERLIILVITTFFVVFATVQHTALPTAGAAVAAQATTIGGK